MTRSETTNLHLKKHDNVSTNENQFDIENYLNGNWDKVDTAYGTANTNIQTNQANITALQNKATALQTENNNLRKALPNITGQGTDITLNNTSDNKFNDLVVGGNTEQTQLTGKNLFNINNVNRLAIGTTIVQNSSYRGYTLPVTAGEKYTISRKEISTPNRFRVCFTIEEPADQVTYYGQGGLNDKNHYLDFTNNIFGTITVPNEMNYLFLYLSNANQTITKDMQIQIENGSTATDFEPFVGGIPSPSPEFPQQIKNVTGNVNVKIQNKNIFNKNATTYFGAATKTVLNTGVRITQSSSGNYRYTSIILGYKELLGKTVTVNATIRNSASNIGGWGIWFGNSSSATVSRIRDLKYDSGNVTFTMPNEFPSNADRIYILLYSNTNGTGNANDYTDYTDLQIEISSTATSYVLHQEQNLPLTLGNIELCKIDTAKDKFIKQNGKWYKHEEIGKIILNGSESWILDNASVGQFHVNIEGITTNAIYSNYFGYKLSYIATGKPYLRPKNNQLFAEIGTEFLSEVSVNALKTWLSTHNTEVYYILATPTETEITDTTLISQLEATLEAMSYYEQTHISSTSDETSAIIEANAVGDLNLILS